MADRKRLLNDLRVIDLRAELEKRNLDKSGVRGVLIQRLTKNLESEGHDPATFKFEVTGPEPKTPAKRPKRSESTVDPEPEETPAMEDMIVQDDAGEEEDADQLDGDQENKSASESQPSGDQDKMEVDENEKANRKRESKDEPETTPSKKPCLDNDKAENNTDAEDSINLDLGEDELLNEETDNTTKNKKDDGASEAAGAERDGDAPGDETTEEAGAVRDGDSASAATSNDTEKKDKDQKDDKGKEGDADKKDKKDDSKEGGARNLWVSGLSGDTRAKDLKQLCSKHGKVIGAKVVTNARTPGSRCYGYVTMASAQDAESCIKNLHRTELHGRMISVEKAKSESESSSRRLPPSRRDERRSSKEKKEEKEENSEAEKNNDSKPKDGETAGVETARSVSRSREKSNNRSDKEKPKRSTRSRERRRSPREVLSFNKIWKERDVARARERSRAAREEERRRRVAEDALRERERRQRQEKHRLALEREKLRAEREKIEREKNELLRLERERHRLEREKLELERLELKRAQLRLEEERRKRNYSGGAYRKAGTPPPEPAYERHKRPVPPPIQSSRSNQFEAPPPPRFEMPAAYERPDKRDRERDYKRDYPRHVPSGNIKYPTNGSTNDDSRQPIPPGTRPKEPSRSYESREGRSYRPSPPGKPDPRWAASTRYPEQPSASKGGAEWASGESREARYGGGGGGGGAGGGGGGGYGARYPGAYQPPPPGAAYPDRYPPAPQPTRDYRKY